MDNISVSSSGIVKDVSSSSDVSKKSDRKSLDEGRMSCKRGGESGLDESRKEDCFENRSSGVSCKKDSLGVLVNMSSDMFGNAFVVSSEESSSVLGNTSLVVLREGPSDMLENESLVVSSKDSFGILENVFGECSSGVLWNDSSEDFFSVLGSSFLIVFVVDSFDMLTSSSPVVLVVDPLVRGSFVVLIVELLVDFFCG